MQFAQMGPLVVSGLLAMLVGMTPGLPSSYEITAVDPPPGYVDFYPGSVNSEGRIVGTALKSATGFARAVVWRNGSAAEIGTPSDLQSHAMAINDAGVVVGDFATNISGGEVHAFSWDGRVLQDLGISGHESGATAINTGGLIVGYERDSQGNARAMMWERGVGHRLDRFQGGFSTSVAVNDRGQAAITAYLSGPGGAPQSYLWEAGALTFVGAFEATAMNASAGVVGYHATPLPDVQGFRWDGTSSHQLGDRDTPVVPLAVNGYGQIVGSTLTSVGTEHAVIWENDNVRDLNDAASAESGWELWRATGINDAGQIVGIGTLHGEQRAFLLTHF